MAANLIEVFSGIQGEGMYVGQRQIFVRFAGCNMRCAYCDTPDARSVPAGFQVEAQAGSREFAERSNPVEEDALLRLLRTLHTSDPSHSAISLTGGEPLLQAESIALLAPRLRALHLALHLETNGVLSNALRHVIDWVDVVAMDVKLSSVTGRANRFDDHRAFLAVAGQREVFVKVIVGVETTTDEIGQVCRMVAGQSKDIPVVIQPVTRTPDGADPPDEQALIRIQSAAALHVRTVRVIPQTHKLMQAL